MAGEHAGRAALQEQHLVVSWDGSSRAGRLASWATPMNALLRWETSMTDMPLAFQSVISD
jgi:hypothetical protein